MAVLLLNFTLRGSLGFGGALGLPLLALVIPVKVLAPAWSLVGIVSSAAIVGRGRMLRPAASFFSGAVGTLFGSMASVFFAMVLDASGAGKQAFRAAVDELTLDSFILCAAALPAMGIGLLVGDRIHSGLSQAAFQRVVCAALFLCGVPLLSK